MDTFIDRRRSLSALGLALGLAFILLAARLPAWSDTSLLPASIDPALERAVGRVSVIVRGHQGQERAVESALARVGGSITRRLPIVDGFAASIPADSIARLSSFAAVRAISLDHRVQVFSTTPGDASMLQSVYPRAVGATDAWSAGYTGRGVTVAVVDTGVNDSPDLAGRLINVYDNPSGQYSACEDLSGEHGCGDSYGHGTFIAGVIAGDGSTSGGAWKGVAPEANIVSVKIAGQDGSSDVSNILAAIQWVVSFKNVYGIRVLNLSLGTDSTESYLNDPLNYAVERAWSSGIAVVVAASNRGPAAGTISKPGDDPYVITVGAVDDQGTPDVSDDALPNFSAHGPTAGDGFSKPDLVAPGSHIVSLRATGSSVDTQFPNYVDAAYRMASGTSMSAAVVSGAIALMLQADPTMTPDRVKYALTSTARPAASLDAMAVGAGEIDVAAALSASPGLANVGLLPSTGLNGIEKSRGHAHVTNGNANIITGWETLQNPHWDGVDYRIGPWDHASWYGSSWYGSTWYGSTWYGSTWYGNSWYGNSWYGSSWYGQLNGSSWYGSSWYGSTWYGVWE